MTAYAQRSVLVDTNIVSAEFIPRRNNAVLRARYAAHLAGVEWVVSFVTVAELRFGALVANWGPQRIDAMEARLRQLRVIGVTSDLAWQCAQMRVECRRAGAAIADKHHEADRWIAASALKHGLPLISNDKIFGAVPGLTHVYEPEQVTPTLAAVPFTQSSTTQTP